MMVKREAIQDKKRDHTAADLVSVQFSSTVLRYPSLSKAELYVHLTISTWPITCRTLVLNTILTSMSQCINFPVIRPPLSHPHTRGLRKSDPVARYHEFRQVWETYKAPGEKNRNNLRWHIRVS